VSATARQAQEQPRLADRLGIKPGQVVQELGYDDDCDEQLREDLREGAGLAVNIRPTVALVVEGIPTLVNGPELDIHRPSYAFGIQKLIRGHAFTLGFSNGPGTVVAQRAGTRASFLGNPSADKPSGLFIGFNLMRRLR